MFRRHAATTAQFAWKNVAYSAQRHPKQTLDIAIPITRYPRRKLPTCVFVHGGSWQRGDKSGMFNNGIDQAFVRAGFVGVSVNYRLSPEVMHPEHTRDIAAAVQWLHTNIEKYGGDADSFFLIGHSAGAHLVMQLLANPLYLEQTGVDPRIIKGIVGISGVYNVVRLANARLYGPLTVNPAFSERVDQWREGSIITALTRHGEQSPLFQIPTLLVTADDDFHFDEDAIELESWLIEGGNTQVERTVVPDRNHFTIIRDLTANADDHTMQRIRRFMQNLMKQDNAR